MQHLDADPDFVQTQAAAILTAAGQMQDATKALYGLAYGDMHSEAVSAFASNIDELAKALSSAWTRYYNTGEALATYAPVLRQVKQEVDAAIAAKSHTDVDGAWRQSEEAHLHAVTQSVNPFASDSDKDDANIAAYHAKAHLEQQQAAANLAQSNYDSAMADLHAAAKIAAQGIEDAIEMSGLNDTFWDHAQQVMNDVHHFLTKALAAVDRILNDLSKVLSVVGLALLALSLLPIPGIEVLAAVGEVFEAAADVVNVTELSVKMLQYLNGDVSFGDLVSDAVFFAVSFLLAPIGGKVAAKGIMKLMDKAPEAVDKLPIDTLLHTGESTVNLPIDSGLDKAHEGTRKHPDPLASFIDGHYQPPAAVTSFLTYGQWQVPNVSHDVDVLTPDFSNIDAQTIVDGSFAGSPVCSPVHGSVVVSGEQSGW